LNVGAAPSRSHRGQMPGTNRVQGALLVVLVALSLARTASVDPEPSCVDAQVTEITVPCFNEEHRFPTDAYVNFARSENPGEERVKFLFVNDGSTDQTLQLLTKLARDHPRSFRVLNLEENVGKAEAVRLGMLHSLSDAKTTPAFVGFWDGDLATPLDEIATFLDVFESRPQTDIVIGSRVALLGRNISRRPERHYLGRVFATGASLVLGLPVYDTQCGAKLFRASDDLVAVLGAPFQSRWIFDVELLARFVRLRETAHPAALPLNVIYEQPLRRWRDIPGSKLKLWNKVRALLELFEIQNAYFMPWSPGFPDAADRINLSSVSWNTIIVAVSVAGGAIAVATFVARVTLVALFCAKKR